MAENQEVTGSSGAVNIQNFLPEIKKQLQTKYRLSELHKSEAVYLVKPDDGLMCIFFSNETYINLDENTFHVTLLKQVHEMFDSMPELKVLKLRGRYSTLEQSPNNSQQENNQQFVTVEEFRHFAEQNKESQDKLLTEIQKVGQTVKQSNNDSSEKIVISFESNISKFMDQLKINNSQTPQNNNDNVRPAAQQQRHSHETLTLQQQQQSDSNNQPQRLSVSPSHGAPEACSG